MSSSKLLNSNLPTVAGHGGATLSGRATSFANAQGAGGSAAVVGTSAEGKISTQQKSIFVKGSDSAQTKVQAKTSDQIVETSTEILVSSNDDDDDDDDTDQITQKITEMYSPTDQLASFRGFSIRVFLGSASNEIITFTDAQDLVLGGGGADVFELQIEGQTNVAEVDIIGDYDASEGDRLSFADSPQPKTEAELAALLSFETLDANDDGIDDATMLRAIADDSIVAILPNTVSSEIVEGTVTFQTTLSIADFLPLDVSVVENNVSDDQRRGQLSSVSAKSSAFANSTGAGSSSSVTVIDGNGNTTTTDQAYQAGATSSSASASVSSSPQGTTVKAIADVPAATTYLLERHDVDLILGTSATDVLTGKDQQDFFVGNDGADIFHLSNVTYSTWKESDIIFDFSVLENDLVQLPDNLNLADIKLTLADINEDKMPDGIFVKSHFSEEFYAVLLDETDVLNVTLLAASSDITAATML